MTRGPEAEAPPGLVPSIGALFGVLVALLVCTAGTTALAFAPLSATMHTIAAVGIAALKAGLVAAYFMHLRHEERLIRVVAVAGLLWLSLLFLFVLVDVGLRAGAR